MTPPRAWHAALLLPYVALSSYLGLTARFFLLSGWGFVAEVWSASLLADIVFAGGTVAAGLSAWYLARTGRIGTSMLVAFPMHSLVYVVSFLLFAGASADGGGTTLRGLEVVPFVISFGIVGLVFASIAPGILVHLDTERPLPEASGAESM